MTGTVIYLLNTVLSGPGVYQVIFEMSPVVQVSSFRVAMTGLAF